MPSTIASVAAGSRLRASTVNTWIDEINNINLDHLRVVKGANTTRAGSSTTLTADPDLVLPLLANTTYIVTGVLFSSANTAADLQFALSFPAGATTPFGAGRMVTTAALTGDGDWGAYDLATSGTSAINIGESGGWQATRFEATVAVSTTPGNVTVLWAQATGHASNYILAKGSHMTATRSR